MKFHTNKKIILFLFVLPILFMSLTGCVKKQGKQYKVGILAALDFFEKTTDGFKDKMTELGYIEGKNIIYEIYETNIPVGNEKIFKKFIDDKVDLIFTFPTEATLEAKAVSVGSNIPIVFAHAGLQDTGIVENITNPGGNLTGVQFPGIEITARNFEITYEIAPNIKRIWLPYMKIIQPCRRKLMNLEKSLPLQV